MKTLYKSDKNLVRFIKQIAIYIRLFPGGPTLKVQYHEAMKYVTELIKAYPGIYVEVTEYVDHDINAYSNTAELPSLQRMLADAKAGKIDLVLARTPNVISKDDGEEYKVIAQLYGCGVVAEIASTLGIVAFRSDHPTTFNPLKNFQQNERG